MTSRSFSDADYILGVYRGYLEERELTSSDLEYLQRKTLEILRGVEDRKSRLAIGDMNFYEGPPDLFSPLRSEDFYELHQRLIAMLAIYKAIDATGRAQLVSSLPGERLSGRYRSLVP